MKIETFKKRFNAELLNTHGFDGIDEIMAKAKNGNWYIITFRKGLPIAKKIKYLSDIKLKEFQKRFDFPDKLLATMMDGNEGYIMTQDKDGILCNITFGKDRLPIVTEHEFWADVSGNERHLYPNLTVKTLVKRNCDDSEKATNNIINWLKNKFNIKQTAIRLKIK